MSIVQVINSHYFDVYWCFKMVSNNYIKILKRVPHVLRLLPGEGGRGWLIRVFINTQNNPAKYIFLSGIEDKN